jgi:hypothetical protein
MDLASGARMRDPVVLGIHADFWTLAYQAIAD